MSEALVQLEQLLGNAGGAEREGTGGTLQMGSARVEGFPTISTSHWVFSWGLLPVELLEVVGGALGEGGSAGETEGIGAALGFPDWFLCLPAVAAEESPLLLEREKLQIL